MHASSSHEWTSELSIEAIFAVLCSQVGYNNFVQNLSISSAFNSVHENDEGWSAKMRVSIKKNNFRKGYGPTEDQVIPRPKLNLNLALFCPSLSFSPSFPFASALPTTHFSVPSPKVPQELLHKSPTTLRDATAIPWPIPTCQGIRNRLQDLKREGVRLRNPRWPLISRHPRFAAIAAARTDRGSIEKRLARRQQHVHDDVSRKFLWDAPKSLQISNHEVRSYTQYDWVPALQIFHENLCCVLIS